MRQLINSFFILLMFQNAILSNNIVPRIDLYEQGVDSVTYDFVLTEDDLKVIHVSKGFDVSIKGKKDNYDVSFVETSNNVLLNNKQGELMGVLVGVDTFTDINIKDSKIVTLKDFENYKNKLLQRYKNVYPNSNFEKEFNKALESKTLKKSTEKIYQKLLNYGFLFWSGRELNVGALYTRPHEKYELTYMVHEKSDSYDLILTLDAKEEYLDRKIKQTTDNFLVKVFSGFFDNYQKSIYKTTISKDLKTVYFFQEIKESKIIFNKTLLLQRISLIEQG